jgi:hypothetical protein
MPNPIALAIPFFFLLIGVEIWLARRRRLSLYRFPDVVASLSCGMTQQILLVFQVAALTGGYVWLYQNHRFFTCGRRCSPSGPSGPCTCRWR